MVMKQDMQMPSVGLSSGGLVSSFNCIRKSDVQLKDIQHPCVGSENIIWNNKNTLTLCLYGVIIVVILRLK